MSNETKTRSEHTPGPWEAEQEHDGEGVPLPTWHVLDNDRVGDAALDSMAQGLTEADARLIAAAPEMLEALEGLIGCLEDHREDTGWVRSLVAKVRGEG